MDLVSRYGHPKRVGLKQYETTYFNNLINDQVAYQGDPSKGGFSQDAPDIYFDARSDHGGGGDDGDDGQGPSHPFGCIPAHLPKAGKCSLTSWVSCCSSKPSQTQGTT